MKKLIVVLLAMVMVFAFAATASAVTWNDNEIPDYTDVANLTEEQQVAIYRLTALGVIDGMNGWGGAYAGDTYFTREQLAKIAVYLSGNEDAVDLYASFGSAFGDIAEGRWSEGYINLCYELGLMKGVSTTAMIFAPTSTVTYQEFATVVLRALGYDDNLPGVWPADYSNKAVKMGLTKYTDYVGPQAINRADMAVMADNALDEDMVTYVGNNSLSGVISAINDNYVDPDGYTYSALYTNEDNGETQNGTMLSEVFDCYPTYVELIFGNDGSDADRNLKEGAAWSLEDGELSFYGFYEDNNEDVDGLSDLGVASNYYIYGADLVTLAGNNGDALIRWNDDEDEFEVLFIEVTSDSELMDYDASDYKAKDFIFDEYLGAWSPYDGEEDVDTALVYTNEDGEIYYIYGYEDFMNRSWGIVDEVKTEKINMKDVLDDGMEYLEGSFKYYDEDDEIEFQLFYDMENDKFIPAADLADGDVLYFAGLVGEEEDYDINLFLVYPVKSAEISKISAGYVYLDGEKTEVLRDSADIFSLYSLDNSDFSAYTYDEVAEFDGATSYTDAYVPGCFTYVCDEVYNSVKGVVVDFDVDYDRHGDYVYTGITLFEADGEEHEYEADDIPVADLDNMTEGDYVKVFMTDGEVADGIEILADWTDSELESIEMEIRDVEDGLIKITDNNSKLAGIDGNYDVAEDAIIYLLSSDGDSYDDGDFDKVELMEVEDLLSDDDDKYLIANFYADGTDADVLYIVDLYDYHTDTALNRVDLKTLGGDEAVRASSRDTYYVVFYGVDGEGAGQDDYKEVEFSNADTPREKMEKYGAGVVFYGLGSNKVAEKAVVIDGFKAIDTYFNQVQNNGLEDGKTYNVDGDKWNVYLGYITDVHDKIVEFNYAGYNGGFQFDYHTDANAKNATVVDIPCVYDIYDGDTNAETDSATVIAYSDLEEDDIAWFITDEDGDLAYVLRLISAEDLEDILPGDVFPGWLN